MSNANPRFENQGKSKAIDEHIRSWADANGMLSSQDAIKKLVDLGYNRGTASTRAYLITDATDVWGVRKLRAPGVKRKKHERLNTSYKARLPTRNKVQPPAPAATLFSRMQELIQSGDFIVGEFLQSRPLVAKLVTEGFRMPSCYSNLARFAEKINRGNWKLRETPIEPYGRNYGMTYTGRKAKGVNKYITGQSQAPKLAVLAGFSTDLSEAVQLVDVMQDAVRKLKGTILGPALKELFEAALKD